MNEVWKKVIDPLVIFEYEVSNHGNVRKITKFGYDECPIRVHSNGYLTVRLRRKGVSWKYYVHRLVATAFIPNPDNKPQVNHKDGNKYNNNVDNLEFVTNYENEMHLVHVLKHKGERIPVNIYKNGKLHLQTKTLAEAMRFLKSTDQTVKRMCETGYNKGLYTAKYADNRLFIPKDDAIYRSKPRHSYALSKYEVDKIVALCSEYYNHENNQTGGNLYLILECGNVETYVIEHCFKITKAKGDSLGSVICEKFMNMAVADRTRVVNKHHIYSGKNKVA